MKVNGKEFQMKRTMAVTVAVLLVVMLPAHSLAGADVRKVE